MKSALIFIFLIFLEFSAIAQEDFIINTEKSSYAVINDVEGFVNVRKSPNSSSPVIGKIENYDIFMVEPNETNWWKIEQVRHNKEYGTTLLDGYIHKSKILILPNFKSKKVKPVLADSYTFKMDDFTILLTKKKFIPKAHKLSHKVNDKLPIDGKGFWGTDGTIPKELLASIKIIKDGKPVAIPSTSYNDLYEPYFETIGVLSGPNNTFYISMHNSDGAGGYTVIWGLKTINSTIATSTIAGNLLKL